MYKYVKKGEYLSDLFNEHCTVLSELIHDYPSLINLSNLLFFLNIYIPSDSHFQYKSNEPIITVIG